MSLFSFTDHLFVFFNRKPETGPGALDVAVHVPKRGESLPLTFWLCYYYCKAVGFSFQPCKDTLLTMFNLSYNPQVLLYKAVSLQPVPLQCFPHQVLV